MTDQPDAGTGDASTGDGVEGTTIGDYRVLETIGIGGMGRVFRALDVRLERFVALKMLPDEVAHDPRRTARFRKEARVLASLNHPNIGAIYDVESHEGHLVLVLELADGPTLADRLAAGPLPVDEASTIALRVASALEAAHARGVVHRDLKPANIALAADGSVKLLDFGIAKTWDQPAASPDRIPTEDLAATGQGQRLGTVSYMSPEQMRGFHVDTRSDVWSFGVVLFEMLAGTKPFQSDNPADMLARILERQPEWEALPRGTPSHLRQLLERCLEKNARQRLQAIGEARLTLESATTRTDGEVPVRSRRGAPPHVVIPALAIVAGLAIVALVTWFDVRRIPGGATEPGERVPIPAPRQISFTGDVLEAVVGPTGPLVATIRQTDTDQVLTVFDLTGGESVDLARGSMFCCLEWSPDASQLAFRRVDSRTVHTVPARGGIERAVAIHDWMLGPRWSPDGTRLADWTQSPPLIRSADIASHDVIWYESPEISDGIRFILDVDWGPTGDFAVVSQTRDGQFRIHAMDAEGDPSEPFEAPVGLQPRIAVGARHLVTHDEPIGGVQWVRADGLYYLLQNGRAWDLMRLDPADPGPPVRVLDGLQILKSELVSFINFAVSHDGLASFANGQSHRNLWVVPFDNTIPPRQLTHGTLRIDRPAVSPEGDRIAYEAAASGPPQIFVFDVESGEARQLTRTLTGAVSPAWSPTGRSIAFVSSDAGQEGLWTISVDGSESVRLEIGELRDVGWRLLEWAPGPDLLVLFPDLAVTRLRNDETVRLLPPGTPGWIFQPRYSPDGRKIAVARNSAQGFGLAVLDGSGPPRILIGGNYYPIGWSPDASRIYAYEATTRRIAAVDPVTGQLQFLRTFPLRASEVQMEVLRDGTGVVAAVEESPGDAMVVDLGSSRE